MINPYLLEQLLTFYRTGTLSAAAEELFISQPALSQSMQKLEEMVGVPLFIRQKNKTDFNENGRLLAEYAQKILALQKEMVSAVREQANHQTSLHLASIAPGPFYLLLPKLKEKFPKLEITSELVNSEEKLLAGLLADQYDLVITHQPNRNDQLTYQTYFSETLSMRLPKSHPLANRSQLTFADLAGQNILLLSDIGFWTEMVKSQIPSANFLYMENTAAFTDVANMGTFPTFISTVAAPPKDPSYKIIPLSERLATAQFYFLLKKANLYKWQNLIEKVQTSLK
ncbi:LysR substrate-binding domain-containing protein [Streptococcus troglodytae]|uniref:HTH lysR-type domain-containing protein n=1 Tax=Streptococcus troglodytae TaxID=1111760 RepID=A0A1L7LJU3_9STRE|nr:LysR family transcriptional regulator [Streptococcus troglodytae]BAQ24463.1 putative uncharacterized protein [Streptococcus troglodytae]